MKNLFDAFISYGRADSKAFATKLHARLVEAGLKVWFDQNDIPLGVDFQNQIDEGIEKAHNFLFIIAPHSVNSPYCLKEIELAIKRNKRIIPLLHVMKISQETWQQRNPKGTPEDWEVYKAKGLHESYQNMHPTIRKLNWVYFQEGIDDFEKSLAGLLEIVERQKSYVYQHTCFLDKALEWKRNQQQSRYLLTGEECQQAQAWLNIQFKDEQPPCFPTDEHCEFITESIKNANHLMTQVFLSHAEEDIVVTEKIRRTLIRHGFTVWTNRTDIKTGTEFQEVINRGIEEADNLVYLISPNSLKSQYCQQEIAYASKLNKHILPLLIEPTDLAEIPPEQRSLQFIDFTKHDDETQYRTVADKLVNVLKEDAWYYELHKILLVKALKWDQKDQPKTLLLKGSELAKAQNWLKQSEQSHKQTAATSLHKAFIAASDQMNQFFDVFISYGRADSLDFAIKLHARLVKQGFNVWFDKEEIPLGVDYQKQIDDGIEKAHNFLYIIAPHSINSPYCGKEIELALKRNKRIIPLLHVEQITQETWQKRNPVGKAEDWEAYKAKGLHTSFQNMHPAIGKINWVYFREEKDDFEASLTGLLELCERQQEYVQQHTYFLAKALEWEWHQKQSRYLLIGDERKQAEAWLTIRFKDEQAPCLPTDLHSEFITESIKNGNNLMTQVFLAHAEEDSQVMDRIRKSLRRECFTVWTNKTDIQTGEAFEDAIERGIEQADNVVYLLSPDSLNSQYCQQELEYALLLNKRIIPILVRETPPERMPPVLRGLHYIDLTDNVREEDYQLDESQLLKILRQDAPYYNEHKILLTKALKWERQHRNPSILLRGYNLDHAKAWLKEAKSRKQHLPTVLQEEFIAESLRQPSAISLDVFVSYSRADSDFARKLNDALQMQGKTTWFDQESIASGADFQQEIYRGIESADNFLFILSPRSVNSPYCADEVEYAAKLNKRFVTVLHRQVNPASLHPELAKVQWIDFNQNERDFSANFSQLIRTLDTDREHLRNHTKWSHRAIEWEQKGKSEDLLLRGNEFAVAENWLLEAERDKKKPAPTLLQQEYIRQSREAIEAGTKRKKRRVVILRSLLGLATLGFVVSAVLGVKALQSEQRAQRGEIDALQQSSEARLALSQPFDALFMALKAAKKLKTAGGVANDPNLQADVVSRLQQSISSLQEINRLEHDEGKIADVSFSPDGKTIATLGDDKTLKLWKPDGRLIFSKPLENREQLKRGWIFSPDGQMIATLTKDKTVKLWGRNGTFISELKDKQGLSEDAIIFSSNSQIIATLSSDSKRVKLWRKDGSQIKTIPLEKGEFRKALSPDGQIITTVKFDEKANLYTVRLRKHDGTVMSTIKGHDQWINDVSFSPDGQIIATASYEATEEALVPVVKLWRQNGTLINTLKGHDEGVSLVKFSPNSQTIVTASYDGTLILWGRNGVRRITLKGHEGNINDVTFSPDGQSIATASADKTVKLWQLDGTLITTLSGHNDYVNKVRFSPDGKMLVSLSDDETVKLWQPDNHFLKAFSSDDKNKNKVDVIPFKNRDNGTWEKIFATTAKNGSVQLWKTDGTITPIKTLIKKSDGDAIVNFSNKGHILVTAINKKNKSYGPVQLWKTDGTPIKTLIEKTPSKGFVNSEFSDDDRTLLTWIKEENSFGPVQLWKADGTLIKTLVEKTPSKGSVNVSFFNKGQSIMTWINDENSFGPVQLWKADGIRIKTLIKKTPSKGSVNVSVSDNSPAIVTTIRDKDSTSSVQLWKGDGTPPTTLIEKSQQWYEGSDLKFSNDGWTLVTTDTDENSARTVKLWKTDGTLIKTLVEKSQEEVDIVFSPDSQTLVTTQTDKNSARTATLWKTGGTRIKTLVEKSQERVSNIVFSPDSQTLVTWVNDGPIKWWKTDGNLIKTLTEKSKGYKLILSFSPNNKTVALENQKRIILWNRDGSKTPDPFDTAHKGDISQVLFSPKGEMIATASYDNTVKFWKPDGTLITTLTYRGDLSDLTFSADGNSLMIQDSKSTVVRRLEGMTDLDTLLEKGCTRMQVYLKNSPNVQDDRKLCDGIGTNQ